MKIDSHQHYWHFNTADYGWMGENMSVIKRDFLPTDLLPELKSIDFDGSVAVQARQSLEETNWLLQLADEHPHIKGVVGWLDLQSEQAETQIAAFAKHPKAVGVRHVIHDEEDIDFMLRPAFIRGVQLLEKYDLAYDILIFPTHLANTIQFVKQFSDKQTFVIDHIAKPLIKDGIVSPWKEDIAALGKLPNVYCKLSGMVTEADWNTWKPENIRPYLDVIMEAFGPERILIGSDWPVCLVAGKYSEVMQVVIDYISTFTEKEQALMLGENAAKAYKIK
ncbi:MAG: amidohydrolase family protein [Paludibacter sp.]|nr:amidohydrolase family protein [Paludibacter sp.]